MNPIKVLEWKGMYPIKKILLVMIWLFGCFLCVAGIIIFISDNDVKNLLVGILFGIGVVVFFSPIKKYVLTTYHCVPGLNSKLQKVELEKLLEGEKNRKLIDLTKRVSKICGKITNADELLVGTRGDINGIIEGENGKAEVRTIEAGGYNIQCFHFRVLVNKVQKEFKKNLKNEKELDSTNAWENKLNSDKDNQWER